MPDIAEKTPAPVKTIPLEMPVIELYENGDFLRELVGGLKKEDVECEISRSLSGMTVFVNRKGDDQHIAALDLRPIISEMAELLTRETT